MRTSVHRHRCPPRLVRAGLLARAHVPPPPSAQKSAFDVPGAKDASAGSRVVVINWRALQEVPPAASAPAPAQRPPHSVTRVSGQRRLKLSRRVLRPQLRGAPPSPRGSSRAALCQRTVSLRGLGRGGYARAMPQVAPNPRSSRTTLLALCSGVWACAPSSCDPSSNLDARRLWVSWGVRDAACAPSATA